MRLDQRQPGSPGRSRPTARRGCASPPIRTGRCHVKVAKAIETAARKAGTGRPEAARCGASGRRGRDRRGAMAGRRVGDEQRRFSTFVGSPAEVVATLIGCRRARACGTRCSSRQRGAGPRQPRPASLLSYCWAVDLHPRAATGPPHAVVCPRPLVYGWRRSVTVADFLAVEPRLPMTGCIMNPPFAKACRRGACRSRAAVPAGPAACSCRLMPASAVTRQNRATMALRRVAEELGVQLSRTSGRGVPGVRDRRRRRDHGLHQRRRPLAPGQARRDRPDPHRPPLAVELAGRKTGRAQGSCRNPLRKGCSNQCLSVRGSSPLWRR